MTAVPHHESQMSNIDMLSDREPSFNDGIVPQALSHILKIYNEYQNGFIRKNYDLKQIFNWYEHCCNCI